MSVNTCSWAKKFWGAEAFEDLDAALVHWWNDLYRSAGGEIK